MSGTRVRLWLGVLGPILAFILLPFAAFGAGMDGWAITLIEHRGAASLTFAAVVILLLMDVLLPIPSSIVSTMAGALLGAPAGALASWIGMSLGSVVGYIAGASAGRQVIQRASGSVSFDSVERDLERFGLGLVALGRAVPVLAEASTLLAGAARLPIRPFLLVSTAANFGVAVVYALVGAFAADVGSFLLAVAGSVALPALGWLLLRILKSPGEPTSRGRH